MHLAAGPKGSSCDCPTADCPLPTADYEVTYLIAALLGVIQGLTEFLPVSSTAHLLVAGRLLGFENPAFTVMIQLGSVLALMWLYRAKIVSVIRGLPSDADARRFAAMILVAFLPAVFAGALLGDRTRPPRG